MRPYDALLADYDRLADTYRSFTDAVCAEISAVVARSGIRAHSITSRTKTKASLEQKLRQRGESYASLDDVTDISGVRIITYFEEDIDKIARALERSFAVDRERSVDKRSLLAPDRFGYVSVHYVISLTAGAPRPAASDGLRAEIQIRSVLQHAWPKSSTI
jgi:putative GTP pyrophosphokinase